MQIVKTATSRPGPVAICLTLAAAQAATSLDRGGFTGSGQRLLLILSAIVLAEMALFVPGALSAAARSPVISSLLAIGALTILSAAWTIGSQAGAVRWGLVICSYSAMALAGGFVARNFGAAPIAIAITLLAAIEAILGLGAAALHNSPTALFLNGSWRPAGTFEYPPALGLLEVWALPGALLLAASRSKPAAAAGVMAVALAGATLGAADSRTDLALAAVVLVAAGAWAKPDELPGRLAAAAGAGLVGGIVAGALIIGHQSSGGAEHGAALRLAGLALIIGLIVLVWPVLVRGARMVNVRRLIAGTVVVIVVAAAAWLLLGYASTLTSTGGGFGHGRISYWRAAFDAWKQRPVLGSGANTFYKASLSYQPVNDATVFAHNLPLELAVELGVPGLIAAGWLYVAAARQLWRSRAVPGAWLLAPAVACFLLDNLVDWTWHLAGLGALWAMAAGGLASLVQTSGGPASRTS